MAKKEREYNTTIGQSIVREEVDEAENYEHNKKVRRGHAEDSRFDEGSTDHNSKIVRPSTTAKITPAKHEPARKWNLGSNHKV